jgi:hypothetical protein
MRYAKSKYPIGAAWQAIDRNGRIGTIWFDEIKNGMEVWRWNSVYDDGRGLRFDWGTSYKMCKYSINVYTRFKRIK